MDENETIGVAGGLGEPVFEIPPAACLMKKGMLVEGSQNPFPGNIISGYAYGAGSVFRN